MLYWQDAITWLLNPLDQSLALLLADNGFDVWLASTRGTKYSLGHTSLSPENSVNFLPSTIYSPYHPTSYVNHLHVICEFLRIIGIGRGTSW